MPRKSQSSLGRVSFGRSPRRSMLALQLKEEQCEVCGRSQETNSVPSSVENQRFHVTSGSQEQKSKVVAVQTAGQVKAC